MCQNFSGALVMDDFKIADGGLAARAPIDHVASAINQAFAIEAQKRFDHRAVERRFEGEIFARPIAGSAEADHLVFDYAAAFRFPLPDAPFEFLATQILAAEFFLGKLALDNKLRGDSGVVHSGEPERVMAAHAVPAHQHVDLRVFEHVADVDRAGDIGRRKSNRERSAIARIFRAEKFFVEPGLGPALFDFLWLVSLGNFPWHGFLALLNFPARRRTTIRAGCGRRQSGG